MGDDGARDGERAIREWVDTRVAATKAGDTATVLDPTTDDAGFTVPGQEPTGKEAFEAAMKEMQERAVRGTSDVRELEVLGDWAYLRNHVEMATARPDGDPVRRSGYPLAMLGTESDGRGRLARDANPATVEEGEPSA